MVFSLYMLGIVVAILTGLVLKYTIMRAKASPFVMELPVYHVPASEKPAAANLATPEGLRITRRESDRDCQHLYWRLEPASRSAASR
ncbi:Ferrous iron transport protein B [Serratia fonticola]|uniref:Ferrous iron transport protein B n=1 Tax=Serratia fonticola TaxID=47917 RepID=A0A4U9WQ38_SERFO|nr:Ferrous iron transport protein B [Serratia fonticola]